MWNNLTLHQLNDIANSENLKQLKLVIDKNLYEELIALLDYSIKYNKKSRALIDAINSSTMAIDAIWLIDSLVGIASFGVWALPLMMAAIAASTLLGGYFFYDRYQKKQQKQTEKIQLLQCAGLKVMALNELIQRENNAIIQLKQRYHFPKQEKKAAYPLFKTNNNPPPIPSKLKSIVLGSATAGTLFFSYALGVPALLESLGYVSVAGLLGGPIGLGIALGIAVIACGIGAYLGYKHYQAQKTALFIKASTREINKEIAFKERHYRNLVTEHNTLKYIGGFSAAIKQSTSASNISTVSAKDSNDRVSIKVLSSVGIYKKSAKQAKQKNDFVAEGGTPKFGAF